MPEVPETRFADTGRGRIAYQVVGAGLVDLLVFHPLLFPIDLMWDEPTLVRFLDRLSSFSRHVWFDPRGRGASDPVAHSEERFAENGADDMLALVDHLGLGQVAVMGFTTALWQPPTWNWSAGEVEVRLVFEEAGKQAYEAVGVWAAPGKATNLYRYSYDTQRAETGYEGGPRSSMAATPGTVNAVLSVAKEIVTGTT